MDKNIGMTKKRLEKEPIEIAKGIYWIGYTDTYGGLHCNPYLIVEGDEAVLIDAGSREDFSTVMLKVLRTGIEPSQIKRLIYQHYDPDLCGSLPQVEAIINSPDLKIISHAENNVFIHYYSDKTEKIDYGTIKDEFVFKTGRKLKFYSTPYSHSPGSFITYDIMTKTLFSSDLFGSYDVNWSLYLKLNNTCHCKDTEECEGKDEKCALWGVINFCKRIMTSNKALTFALDIIDSLDINIVAPQHGSILGTKEDVKAASRMLRSIEHVGINRYLKGKRNES